jgi:hypothetical protein
MTEPLGKAKAPRACLNLQQEKAEHWLSARLYRIITFPRANIENQGPCRWTCRRQLSRTTKNIPEMLAVVDAPLVIGVANKNAPGAA